MSERQSSRVPFSPDRVKQAIKFAGRKKRDLFPETDRERRDADQMLSRSYRRCASEKLIKPANLEWLARELGVATAYLAGELDQHLAKLDDKELRKAYEERFLDPARFPYDGWYQLRSQVDYEEYERQILEVHGVAHSRLKSLSAYEQISLLSDIDSTVCKIMERVFPDCVKIDFYDIFQGYDTSDIIDYLIDDLANDFPNGDPHFEDQGQQEDRFAAKYMNEHVNKKLWGYGCTLDVIAEGGNASSWQAIAISNLDNKWSHVDDSAKKLKSFIRENYPTLFDDSEIDLYWMVRPKALIASGSCTEHMRDVTVRCDCKIGHHRQLDIRFHNEELEGIYLD